MRPGYLCSLNPPIEVMNHLTTTTHSSGPCRISTAEEDNTTDRFPLTRVIRNEGSTTRMAQKLFQKMATLILTQTSPPTLTVNCLPQKAATTQKTPSTERQTERRQEDESTNVQTRSLECPSPRLGVANSWRVGAHQSRVRLVSAGWESSQQSLTQSRQRQVSPLCRGIRCGARVWQVRSRRSRDQRKCIVSRRACSEKGRVLCVCQTVQLSLISACPLHFALFH